MKEKFQNAKDYLIIFFRWVITGIAMGIAGGLLGALFHHALHFVTEIRLEHPWLIFLLPLGGLLSVYLYKVTGLSNNRGTNEMIEAALDGHQVKPQIGIGIFLAAAITHLFGGSAGREGAALQIGGAAAALFGKAFHFSRENRKLLMMAGMSAVFAGLFGTPLTAMIFCMEFEAIGTIFSPALLPCFLSAFIASRVSLLFGVHAETHLIDTAFSLSPIDFGRYFILAILISLLGILMCESFHKAEHFASHHLKNPYVRIFIGGLIIVVMTLLAGDQRFNGAGMDMALQAVSGSADWYSFIVKLIFTTVTLAAGLKGGEIVPTFCIGATFGCVVGSFLGIDAGFAGALGLVGLFCCVTNSPIASILLSIEMFSGSNIYVFAFVCVICFVLSGNSGLYGSQRIPFGKELRIGKFKES